MIMSPSVKRVVNGALFVACWIRMAEQLIICIWPLFHLSLVWKYLIAYQDVVLCGGANSCSELCKGFWSMQKIGKDKCTKTWRIWQCQFENSFLTSHSILIFNFWLATKITGKHKIYAILIFLPHFDKRVNLREWIEADVITGSGRYGERWQRMQSQICFEIFHSVNIQKKQKWVPGAFPGG